MVRELFAGGMERRRAIRDGKIVFNGNIKGRRRKRRVRSRVFDACLTAYGVLHSLLS